MAAPGSAVGISPPAKRTHGSPQPEWARGPRITFESAPGVNPFAGWAPEAGTPGRVARLVPWLLLLVSLVGVGIAGLYVREQWRYLNDAMRSVQAELRDARARAGALDKRARAAVAARESSRGELESLNTHKQRTRDEAEKMAAALRALLSPGEAEVVRDGGRIILLFGRQELFRTGKEELSDSGVRLLLKAAKVFDEYPERMVTVRGHAEEGEQASQARSRRRRGRSGSSSSSRSGGGDWELAARRAIAIVRFLQEKRRMDPQRLEVVAVGKHQPLPPTSKGGARAIEIVLSPIEK